MAVMIEGLENRRLMASGTVDTTFNAGGTNTARIGLNAGNGEAAVYPSQVVVDAVGRSLVLARTSQSVTLYRLTEAGTLDAGFAAATGGYLRIDLPKGVRQGRGLNDVRVGQDGFNRYYLLIGPQVIRLSSSGKIDRTYGRRGNATLAAFAGANDVAVKEDGTAYVVGSVAAGGSNTRMAVARLTAAGALDAKFGDRGVVGAPVIGPSTANPGLSRGEFVRVLLDGSVVVTGYLQVTVQADFGPSTGTGAVTLKFKADGTPDTAYGKKGRSIYSVFTSDISFPEANPVAIRGDGAVVLYTRSSSDSPDDTGTSGNRIELATGRSSAAVDLVPGSDDPVLRGEFVYDTNVFAGAAEVGAEYLIDVSAATLVRVTKTGAIDPGFHGGQPVAGVQAAATTNGGAVVVAGTGGNGLDDRLTVSRRFADEGPSVQALAAPIVVPAKSRTITFRIRDDDGVSVLNTREQFTATLVKDSHHPVTGKLLSGSSEADGTLVLTYGFTGPGGNWDAADNGRYLIDVDNAFDTVGAFAPMHTLGTLLVQIA